MNKWPWFKNMRMCSVSFMIPFALFFFFCCCLLPNSTHKAQTVVNTCCEVFSGVLRFVEKRFSFLASFFGAGFNTSWNGYSVHYVIIVNEYNCI